MVSSIQPHPQSHQLALKAKEEEIKHKNEVEALKLSQCEGMKKETTKLINKGISDTQVGVANLSWPTLNICFQKYIKNLQDHRWKVQVTDPSFVDSIEINVSEKRIAFFREPLTFCPEDSFG